jgi:hypothetical protein
MAYNNFKRTFWSKFIQTENQKYCLLEKLCDYKFEKEVKHGEKVKILGVTRPTIGDYTGVSIGDPEVVNDNSLYLEIDQAKYFNFMVGDIDAVQGQEGLMEAITEEAARGLAEARDTRIAYIMGTQGKGLNAAAGEQLETQDKIKAAVDAAFTWLQTNASVRMGKDKMFIVLTPWAHTLFKNELVELKTANDELIKKGVVGTYNNAEVYISNNLLNAKNGGKTNDHMLIGTTKAVAFASQIEKVVPYEPHGFFADALKGLDVYGCRAVRSKELYVIRGRLTA